MSTGRCAGCGRTGPEKNVMAHIISCPDWAVLYREAHDDDLMVASRALLPVAEYARWSREDKVAEHAAMVTRLKADAANFRAVAAAAFTREDPLSTGSFPLVVGTFVNGKGQPLSGVVAMRSVAGQSVVAHNIREEGS